MSGLRLAHPGLDVAKDQLPSPWSLGAPAGKDICQRESWQLYFLFHLGLSLIHPSCSFPFSFIFFLFSSHSTPPFHYFVFLLLYLVLHFPSCLSFSHSLLTLSSFLTLNDLLLFLTISFPSLLQGGQTPMPSPSFSLPLCM